MDDSINESRGEVGVRCGVSAPTCCMKGSRNTLLHRRLAAAAPAPVPLSAISPVPAPAVAEAVLLRFTAKSSTHDSSQSACEGFTLAAPMPGPDVDVEVLVLTVVQHNHILCCSLATSVALSIASKAALVLSPTRSTALPIHWSKMFRMSVGSEQTLSSARKALMSNPRVFIPPPFGTAFTVDCFPTEGMRGESVLSMSLMNSNCFRITRPGTISDADADAV